MTAVSHAFGRGLRNARERRSIELSAVAESTKIKLSLLASLEYGDVSQWPPGIFRRAFVRAYATAIGLQPDAVLAEFSKLFPEDGEVQTGELLEGERVLRLTLAVDEPFLGSAMTTRVQAAFIDFSVLVGLAAGITYLAGTGFWLTACVAALAYYSVTTAWLGRTAASWWLNTRLRDRVKTNPAAARPVVTTPDRFQVVSRRPDAPRRPGATEPEWHQAEDAPPAAAGGRG